MKKLFYLLVLFSTQAFSQEIALLKYSGGGDWYANPTSLPNLIKYCNATINTQIKSKPATVDPSSPDLLSYPFVHMTGHGNVVFSDSDVSNLKNYLLAGGFLHIDDNYGMDQYIRKEIKKIFPKNTNNAIGRLSGVKKKFINKIFNVTGKMTILASVTYRPVIKERPQRNSSDFARGIK